MHRTMLPILALMLVGAGCSSGVCGDIDDTLGMLREKAVRCGDFARDASRLFVTSEAVDACEPYAEKYCSDSDRSLIDSWSGCVDDLAACSGDGEAFGEALEACFDKLDGLSEQCAEIVGRLL
jgi:hypothetical protein